MVADEQVQAFLRNPVNFLYSIEWRQNLCHFVPANREVISKLPFLDMRTLGTSQKKGVLPLDQVIRLSPGMSGVCDFIFHSAFCCSTLLASCLDRPGRVLALKEPFSVLNLAGWNRALETERGPYDFKTLCSTTLALSSRPFSAGERTLIKPSNGANNLLPSILSEPGCGRVLLVYGTLEDFLVSVISGGARRQTFIDGILPLFITDFGADLEIKRLEGLGRLERAALVWGLQVRLFSEVSTEASPEKVKTLKTQDFLDNRVKTLSALNDFFGYGFSETEINETFEGPLLGTHAKEPFKTFLPEEKEKEKQDVLSQNKIEISKAVKFAKTMGLWFPEKLPNSL